MTIPLAAREIAVRYDAHREPILHGLTLELQAGELVGVIGPNGSGKSTLVRTLSRALRPTAGVVLLDDTDLYAQTPARRSAQRIGVVPQSAAVSFDFSVREIVRMGRDPHLPSRPFAGDSPGDERIVEESLGIVGVTELAERLATTLSGGEWQRVLLARALTQQPDVLLLDEPTAHLDIRHQWDVLGLARKLAHREGKAVLAVLHDLNLAAAFCHRLVLLFQGRIVADGSPAHVLTPANIFAVYGTSVSVMSHPESGRPYILPPSASEE